MIGLRRASRSVQCPDPNLARLERPSAVPSIKPNHAAATPIEARNAGSIVVAASCDQSLNSDARPMPSTVELSQRRGAATPLDWAEVMLLNIADKLPSVQVAFRGQ